MFTLDRSLTLRSMYVRKVKDSFDDLDVSCRTGSPDVGVVSRSGCVDVRGTVESGPVVVREKSERRGEKKDY